MGNCLARCFGRIDKRRKYLRTKYSVERDISIEFENLMDDVICFVSLSRLVTDRERLLLSSKQYTALLNEQKRIDTDIDQQLSKQEEELRAEEEAYYEAKREAARIAKLQKVKEKAAKGKNATTKGGRSWLGDDENEWEVAGGDDDFEMFLASVKARSMKVRANVRHGSGDCQSSNSSGTAQTRDRSHTEASSLDLEWDHEEGVVPQKKPRSSTEENLVALTKKFSDSPQNSQDLEWDNDYVSSQDSEAQQLLAAEQKIAEFSSR
ncbi:hypothetical protein ScPMuIL_004566 [Solemya velum]